MSKIVLDCSKCGGALEVTDDMEMFRCQYCNTPYLVERKDGTTRIIRLEQRVSQLEEKQVATESAVSEIGVKQELLDSDVARLELKEIQEQKQAFVDQWAKENPGAIGAAIGAVVVTFALVFCVSVFGIVEFNDTTGPLAFFVFPVIVGAFAVAGWVSKYRAFKKQLDGFEKKEQEICQRIKAHR